jgi:hypothetical protein
MSTSSMAWALATPSSTPHLCQRLSTWRFSAGPASLDVPRFVCWPIHDLGTGADEFELPVDEKRGIILRSEGRLRGLPFRVIEMDEVVFDEDLGSECFTLLPPTGQDFEVTNPSTLAGTHGSPPRLAPT